MPVIEATNLHKRYGSTVAVDDVSFSVEEGEIFGILGPNGAGKTTTVECIGGLREFDRGKLRVLGLDPRRDRQQLRELVGVQLQEAALPPKLEVREALELYASFYRDPASIDDLLGALQLESKQHTRFSKLSGGQRQRLSIALALVGRPRIAILDELTTGLDPAARRDTWALVEQVRSMGVTILLVTHFMDEAERLCDRVAVIDGGRVVAIDTPTALSSALAREQRLRFRPSAPLDDDVLWTLGCVTAVDHTRDGVIVTGTGDQLVTDVVRALADAGVVAEALRVEQANLEDAFVALTDH
jgi:ABC-2 type transport system ATP-binding protein